MVNRLKATYAWCPQLSVIGRQNYGGLRGLILLEPIFIRSKLLHYLGYFSENLEIGIKKETTLCKFGPLFHKKSSYDT